MGLGNFFKKIGHGVAAVGKGVVEVAAAGAEAEQQERAERIAEYRALHPEFLELSDDDIYFRVHPVCERPVVVERPVIIERPRVEERPHFEPPHGRR
jgi:hypothetical protein